MVSNKGLRFREELAMFNYCRHEYKLIREHGEQLSAKHWKELQEQAGGRTLYALVTVDLSNLVLAVMLDDRKKWIFAITDKDQLKALHELPTPLKLVGIYAMDSDVLDTLHGEAHAQEDGLDELLLDPEILGSLLGALGAHRGNRSPMIFGGVNLSDL